MSFGNRGLNRSAYTSLPHDIDCAKYVRPILIGAVGFSAVSLVSLVDRFAANLLKQCPEKATWVTFANEHDA